LRISLRRIGLLSVFLALLVASGHSPAAPPEDRIAALRRGINITGWFRYPVSRDPALLRRYMADDAMRALRGRASPGFASRLIRP
jgi:hypothetical protein